MDATNVLAVILYIMFIALYIFLFFAIKRVRTKGTFGWIAAFGAAIVGILLFLYLSLNIENIEPADWAQIFPLLGLVAVTGFYALSSSRQADASAQMAKEMREQRIIASRPVIIQKSVYEKDIWEGNNKDYFSHFEISNAGNTPAIEIVSSVVDNENNSLHSIRQTYLSKDDPPIKFYPYGIENLEEDKTYYLICDYKSIFSYGKQKSLYQSRLPFKIGKAAEEGKIYVIPGELETKEVTDKDFISAFGSKPK